MTKEKNERGGVNSLKSGAEFKKNEYAFIVELKKSGTENGLETIDLQVGGVVIRSVLID